jgi:hypothetical protein
VERGCVTACLAAHRAARTEWDGAVGYRLELHRAGVENDIRLAWAGEDVH